MADGDVVSAHFGRNIEVGQGVFGRIEGRVEIVEVDGGEEAQIGVAGEGGGEAGIVVAGGSKGADSAAREIEEAVGVGGEGEFAAQVGLIGGLESAGERAEFEIDGRRRGSAEAATTTAAAASTGGCGQEAGEAGIGRGEPAMLV